mgnify:CR=1 FL=1
MFGLTPLSFANSGVVSTHAGLEVAAVASLEAFSMFAPIELFVCVLKHACKKSPLFLAGLAGRLVGHFCLVGCLAGHGVFLPVLLDASSTGGGLLSFGIAPGNPVTDRTKDVTRFV